MLELIVVVVSIAVFLIIFRFIYKFKLHQHNKYIAGELEKECRRNVSLESDLRQTKQRVEYLSSKNKHLSNELEKERRHNVNLSRKLGVSESSLTEVRQHNERLTSALTQASQRNKQLSNKLEQESQRNANLERKLEISGYSGHPALLDRIYSAKQLRTDSQKRSYLQKLRDPAIELWREYQSSDISPDYSRQDYQEAYLLCYFLPYSQPVPYLLNHLILKKDFPCQLPEDGSLTASFFGCGPGPELFGLMRYLGGPQSDINIFAAMFDIQPAWKYARKIVFQHLLDRVWDSNSHKIHKFESDLVGGPRDFLPDGSEKWVRESDLIVIQHCLNERHNAKSERLIENMKQLVGEMKTGAVMLIIERARYSIVNKLLKQFCYELQKKFGDSLDIERKITKHGIEVKPILDVIPKALATYFFLEESVNSINSVKFIWMAVAKK